LGRDTVAVVLKNDCPQVLFFPNAFTPNDDGLNDIFKPFTAAPLEKYSLQIYNRWGQMVFTSNDPLKGWNGKYHGVDITPGVYVYLCSYKFYNKSQDMMKGTVIVVK